MKCKNWLLLTTILLFVLSCTYDNKEDLYEPIEIDPCMSEMVSFSEEVFPIIESNCNTSGCHNSNDRAANIVLTTYQEVLIYVDNDELVKVIKHEGDLTPMPLGRAKMLSCDIGLIESWVNNGAPNN